jgi:hypothetical protein
VYLERLVDVCRLTERCEDDRSLCYLRKGAEATTLLLSHLESDYQNVVLDVFSGFYLHALALWLNLTICNRRTAVDELYAVTIALLVSHSVLSNYWEL